MPKSKTDIHITPDRVFDLIKEYWGYSKEDMFDPCPVDYKYDALKTVWQKLNYVNPPYTLLSVFVSEAIKQLDFRGNETVMLLPAKTDQEWFHWLTHDEYEIKWIRSRLKFKGAKTNSPQPHFLVMIK